MADRYWVGGSGSWNSTSKWSTTSGGASGASVPTASDNAIFDTASGTAHFVVTVTDNATCADLTITPENVDGFTTFSVGTNFVVAGTFSTSGTLGNRRILFRSSTEGLVRDMNIAVIGTVTDVDFRYIRITGVGGTLTGTRIGDLGGNLNITADTPKTVYWVTAGGGNWSGNNWSDAIGGTANTDYFPLAQDTASFQNTGLNTSATVTWDNPISYTGTVDMSSRTNAMTLSLSAARTVYGDWKNGSGTTLSGNQTLTFSKYLGTQTITSSGKTFSGNITFSGYGSTLELADALNIGTRTLTLTTGTFDTKDYNLTAGAFQNSGSEIQAVYLGSSTITLSSSFSVSSAQYLTFDAGTSKIVLSGNQLFFNTSVHDLYDVEFTGTASSFASLSCSPGRSVRNLTFSAPSSAGIRSYSIGPNFTVTGTLSATGASAVRRIQLRSSAQGLTRTLTVATLSADNCDFADITIAGAAANSSPVRAGDLGGNSGIVFPAPKTVYWNLAGTQNWTATAWCQNSGGTPDIDLYPLPQDTAVFNEDSAVGTVSVSTVLCCGTVDMSARTSAMTLSVTSPFQVFGDWKFGTGVTTSSANTSTSFHKRGTSSITSNGVSFNTNIDIDALGGTVQLADALSVSSSRTFIVTRGTFDAVTYNVTTGVFSSSQSQLRAVKMGSGTWTLSGTGSVWNLGFSPTNLFFDKGTAEILLSNTSTTARTFAGGGQAYNKLTIGGTTGTSTLTIEGNNTLAELASTKTVAHTIALGSTTQRFGKWSVTGTSGNVVTFTGTGTSHRIAGACTDGIDYLAMGSIGFSADSPGEFYAGNNSTGTAGAPVYRTSKPADSVRYWVGGTGDWNDTNRWSTGSGGSGGASLPRSHDDVVFDSLSASSDYTVTVNSITGGNRCKSLTVSGPSSGTLTLTGSTALNVHDDITLPSTGLTVSYTGGVTLTGSSTGKTLTTNGVSLDSNITVDGVGSEWALGSSLTSAGRTVSILTGSFALGSYNLTTGSLRSSDSLADRSYDLGSGTVTLSSELKFPEGSDTSFDTLSARFTLVSGTSQINLSSNTPTFSGGGKTFYNVSFTSSSLSTASVNGQNTFNNLTVAGRSSAGLAEVEFSANQTINGTLTISAGSNPTCRTMLRSFVYTLAASAGVGTSRTLTCNAVATLTDVDFRDIAIAGAAVSGGNVSGTRLGDCKGNSGITFTSPKTVYWAGTSTLWTGNSWASTLGGSADFANFPLAQDTAVVGASSPASGSTIEISNSFNLGTVDLSARTSDTLTFDINSLPTVYGSWINGSGVTITTSGGSGVISFAGRTSQAITASGGSFPTPVVINTPGGSVTLQDALSVTATGTAITLLRGGFDANGYNVTVTNAFSTNSQATRTLAVGDGTWTISGSGTAFSIGSGLAEQTGLTVTGSGTIRMASGSDKTFQGNGFGSDLSGISLDQGGAGTLTISGNNTLKDISNSYASTGATTIRFGAATITRVKRFTASGQATRVLTLTGNSSTSPCTLVYIGDASEVSGLDYLTITGVRAYPL